MATQLKIPIQTVQQFIAACIASNNGGSATESHYLKLETAEQPVNKVFFNKFFRQNQTPIWTLRNNMILQQYKIVFAGSMGAGKTEALSPFLKFQSATRSINTDSQAHNKMQTTVGIDYGEITLDDGVKIGLYGTPGSITTLSGLLLVRVLLGVILLIDHNSKLPLEELEGYLDTFKDYTKKIFRWYYAWMKTKDHTTSIYREWLIQNSINIPCFY